ncbi:MAG TPA: hypothetical protein VHZ24_06755 [Pirellulales bacterium]|jgi:hypothetical protein|nr:hypothetical protein [Pirellulales bacterium]
MTAERVEIVFDCLPLRSVGRLDVPLDASPKFQAQCQRIKHALAKHGAHNSFYLHNATCAFYLTNDPHLGMIQFRFEGTVLTDAADQNTAHAHLDVTLERETCDWLTQPIVAWFAETVPRAVIVEFDRYIAAGDLQATLERMKRLEAETDAQGGYMGMYL